MNPSAALPSTQRSLAAIVLTDAASFSARMSIDEESTLHMIQRDLKLMADLCDQYGGQVLKSTGDGLLMAFNSAVQAVSCSQEIQKELANLAEGLSPDEHLQHRVGIHLGDVLFSHGDVLGNGVNIAARLQSRSIPGGICLSRTVYDVVKARLNINATFLGPLQLKNIKEPVPAFQIPPVGETATAVVPRPEASSGDKDSVLAVAARSLQQDSQSRRIKKLIFGTCKGNWENDPTVLAQFELLPLLQTLCDRYATLPSLKNALQSMAGRLNRKAEYFAVTDLILTALKPAYATATDLIEPEEETDIHDAPNPYQVIALSLEQQPEQLRIKKLLHAIIHTAWANDPTVLIQQSMQAMVETVHQKMPTEAALSDRLSQIIRRLNHQSRYTQVGLVISEAFQLLYGTPHEPFASDDSPAAQPGDLVVSEQTAIDLPAEEGLTCITPEEGMTRLSSKTRPPTMDDDAAYIPEPKERDRANLFNLRTEIMRYTNPLRAKILLLSTVRSPFAYTHQDWLTLKSKTLDDLIQDAFTYCKTYADLKSKLTIMCHCVDNEVENSQAAGAILQAMKPFYPSAAVPQRQR